MVNAQTLKICQFVAVERGTTNAIKLLEAGLKHYKLDGSGNRAAQTCKLALYHVLKDVEKMVRVVTYFRLHEDESLSADVTAKEVMKIAQAHLEAAAQVMKADPTWAFYKYYDALCVLYMGSDRVRQAELRPYYSMLAVVLNKIAKLGGALKKLLLPNAAELQVVALVITEYVLGPATRKSVQNRLMTTRLYHEAMKVYLKEAAAAKAKGKADLEEQFLDVAKVNVRQAKKYGADSCHAARYVYGMVSKMTLSAYRLYVNVQEDRYRLEKYTDENWDFNVIHETYTYLLEQLNVSR
jgi:hypothetical protein